jgi:hypothetical protein
MQRIAASLMLCAGLCYSAGCFHMVNAEALLSLNENPENRVVTSFVAALEKGDLDVLRALSSESFQASALRRPDALDAMQQLGFPTGEAKILEAKEKDDGQDRKQVSAEIGEKQRQLAFFLTRENGSKKWVVDDVKFKRKLKPGQENKTMAEQMDLLLSIRDFLDAWGSGERDEVLRNTTPAFGQLLGELPPGCLAKLTKQIGGEGGAQNGLRPNVEGHQEMALVRVNRKSGEMLMTLRYTDGRWKADDVHVQQKRDGDHVPSVRKLATAMLTTIAFYEAYQSVNKDALAGICTDRFFKTSLAVADLSALKLPEHRVRDAEFETKIQGTHAMAILQGDREIVQISLVQETSDQAAQDALPVYRVEDVSFFELNGTQEKRMSALFTSQEVMQVFSEALAARDLKTLQLTATHDFNARAWNHLTSLQLAEMPLAQIEASPPRVLDVAFKGPVTEITVSQGQTPLTYVLRDQAGKLLVDEVLFPALDRPGELKTTLELMIPTRAFAAGLQTGSAASLRTVSSREFNKVVWNQTEAIPQLPEAPAAFLKAPLNKIQLAPERAIIILGDEHWGAKVFLVKEGERYLVDDVVLIAGLEQHQRIGLKQRVRAQLATGKASRDAAAADALPQPGTEP